jgi:hypothetical protein
MPIRSRYIALSDHRNRSIDTGGNALVILLLHGISSMLDDDDPSALACKNIRNAFPRPLQSSFAFIFQEPALV